MKNVFELGWNQDGEILVDKYNEIRLNERYSLISEWADFIFVDK